MLNMTTMKAAVLTAKQQIEYVDYPRPTIKDDEILVRVRAAGICGSDLPRFFNGAVHKFPIVLGHEFSGEVAEIGKNVKSFKKSNRVACAPLIPCHKCADCVTGDYALCKNYTFIGSRIQGAFADYVAVPAINAVKFLDTVSFEQAAFFEPSTVALHGIYLNKFKPGGMVAILGGGTIGMFALQWCKILGAKSVTVFDISDERLALAREFGAETINSQKDDIKTYAGKFDYVFETAGRTETIKAAFDICANKAKVCLIGTPTQDLCFTPAEWEKLNRKEFALSGSWMSYSKGYPGNEWRLTAKHFADGSLKIAPSFIGAKYLMKDAQKAFMLFSDSKNIKGKILLTND